MRPYSYEVSLSISHATMEPDSITKALNLEPEDSHRAGDLRRTPKGTLLDGHYEESFWQHSYQVPDNSDFESTLCHIADSLAARLNLFRAITGSGGRAVLSIGLFSDGNIGATITHDLMRSLSELTIDLELDIYAYRESIAS